MADKATITYGLPPPIRWTFKRPLPAPHYGCWVRIAAAPPDPTGHHFCVEWHPWQSDPPPDAITWQPLALDRELGGRFATFTEAVAWVKGLLHGSAWLQEFAPENMPSLSLGTSFLLDAALALMIRRLQAPLPECTCANCLIDFRTVLLVEGWNCGTCRMNHDPAHACCPRALAVQQILTEAKALLPDP